MPPGEIGVQLVHRKGGHQPHRGHQHGVIARGQIARTAPGQPAEGRDKGQSHPQCVHGEELRCGAPPGHAQRAGVREPRVQGRGRQHHERNDCVQRQNPPPAGRFAQHGSQREDRAQYGPFGERVGAHERVEEHDAAGDCEPPRPARRLGADKGRDGGAGAGGGEHEVGLGGQIGEDLHPFRVKGLGQRHAREPVRKPHRPAEARTEDHQQQRRPAHPPIRHAHRQQPVQGEQEKKHRRNAGGMKHLEQGQPRPAAEAAVDPPLRIEVGAGQRFGRHEVFNEGVSVAALARHHQIAPSARRAPAHQAHELFPLPGGITPVQVGKRSKQHQRQPEQQHKTTPVRCCGCGGRHLYPSSRSCRSMSRMTASGAFSSAPPGDTSG